MVNFQYITDFHKSRGQRIGASDIPKIIPHPERPTESLAGYKQTAITLYEEKIGLKKREAGGFSASMGKTLEPVILREFIKEFSGGFLEVDISDKFYRGYMLCELDKVWNKNLDCQPFNSTQFKHHTEVANDFGIAHVDCMFIPKMKTSKKQITKKNSLAIDFTKPFIIEAKTAQYWVVQNRKQDKFSGYDLELKKWQGIPLKHYFQIQYQMALYDIDMAYLSLLYNTSEKHYWQIKANKKHQNELLELASYMKQCIDKKQPPKKLAMNSSDIRKLYPEIKEDFQEIIEGELEQAVTIAKDFQKALTQEKSWKKKKEDCENAMSILLKDNQELKGIINDELQSIAKWKTTGGGERIKALSKIKIENERIYKYLMKNKMIENSKKNLKPNIILKEFE